MSAPSYSRLRVHLLGAVLLLALITALAFWGWRFAGGLAGGFLLAVVTLALQEVGNIPTRRHNALTCPYRTRRMRLGETSPPRAD